MDKQVVHIIYVIICGIYDYKSSHIAKHICHVLELCKNSLGLAYGTLNIA
jgi:hypothetical protein